MLGIPYELAFFSEIDDAAIKSYCAIHKESPQKNFGDLKNVEKVPLPNDLDLIIGGTPCQDFSLAGKGAGGEEGSGTRSSLMWYYIRLISLYKPKVVIWENVAGVLTHVHMQNYRKFISQSLQTFPAFCPETAASPDGLFQYDVGQIQRV